MQSLLRFCARPAFITAALLLVAAPAAAQGFGIGARLAWIKTTSDIEELDNDSQRFYGGYIRLSGARVGVEVSLDRHTETLELLNQKVTETPFQVSLMLKLAGGSVQPYLLGGPGWYYRSVSPIDGPADELDVSTHDFGWHAGGGLEVRAGNHFGFHGDYRYTFLDFGNDDDEEIDIPGGGFVGRILPGHKGSMITIGATLYF
jgi:opacity protein-like surface antigen